MNERCTFFRIGRDQAKQLFACRTPEALQAFIEALDSSSSLEGGAAALALHRVLTDGTLEPEAGDYPLNHAVLGGRVLGHDNGFAVILKRPDMCPHIGEGLIKVKPETVESSLAQLRSAQPETFVGIESSDIALLLSKLTALFLAAAKEGEAVVLVRRTTV